jgi:esterase/lipase
MRLFKMLGSEEKSYLMFDMDRHVIVGGKGARKVHKAVGDFVESALKK